MTPAPLVSVIMAARNVQSILDEQVAAVLGEREVPLELLICDDASVDGTWKRMQRWATNPRVRLFRNVRRQRQAETRNRLIATARGRYLAPCDADDLLMPGALAALAHGLESHPEAVLAWGSLLQVFTEKNRRDAPRVLRAVEGWDMAGAGALHGGCLMRSRTVRAVHGYDATLRLADDWDLLMRLRERGPFLAMPERITYIWRLRAKSLGRISRGRQAELDQIVSAAARRRRAAPLPELRKTGTSSIRTAAKP